MSISYGQTIFKYHHIAKPYRYWKLLAALQVFRSRLPALGVDYQEAALAQLEIQEECRTIFWDDVERFSQVNRSEPAG